MTKKRKPHGYWKVKENVLRAARECPHPTTFERKYKGAFRAAEKYGWQEEAYAHMKVRRKTPWTIEEVMERAKPYSSRYHFSLGEKRAFNVAVENGWLEIVCEHMEPHKNRLSHEQAVERLLARSIELLGTYERWVDTYSFRCLKCSHEWEAVAGNELSLSNDGCVKCNGFYRRTPDEYREEIMALGFEPLADFQNVNDPLPHKCLECGRGADGEWTVAPSNLLGGMGCRNCSDVPTDGDVFYIWQNVSDDRPVFKIGITSKRCEGKYDRMKQTARSNGMKAKLILKVDCPDARDVEAEVLKLGKSPNYGSEVEGHTEFRILNPRQLERAIEIAQSRAE